MVLSDEHAAKVEAAVLPNAPEQTLAQLKAALARAIIAADPEGAEERHREARRDRRVVVTAEPDGMGTLWAMLTATDAAGAFTWLTRLARGLGRDDPRSMDTRRADILAALLNGRLVTNPDTETDTGPDRRRDRRRTAGGADAATSPTATRPRSTSPRLPSSRPTSPVAASRPGRVGVGRSSRSPPPSRSSRSSSRTRR